MSVRVEWFDAVCSIVIDRPEKRNAVDLATLRDIAKAQSEARSARVVVLYFVFQNVNRLLPPNL